MSTVPVCPPVWPGSDAELLAELRTLETQLHSTWAQMLSVITEIDSRGTAATVGYGTTVELVRTVARVSRGEARARVSAAADVLPTRGLDGAPVQPKLAQTAAAVAEHAIGAADVAVIRSVLARIPPHLGQDKRAEVEAELARHARTLDAGQLAVLGKRILTYLDQDGPRPHDTPETRRRLSFHDRDGGYELAGWLDREAAEIVRCALSPLAAPRPTTDTEVDLRNAAQRDADALVDLAQRALGSGELPTDGGERPQVVVTVSLPVLQGRIGSASLALGGPINTDIARRIACDAQVIPIVLGSKGEPLDVGRASHTLPAAIRRAVIVRDRGCAFSGLLCTSPLVRHSPCGPLGRPRLDQRRELCRALRPAPSTHPPFRLANRHGQRHPRIPSTTMAGRTSTPQPPPHRPRTDPSPPIVADCCAHVPT